MWQEAGIPLEAVLRGIDAAFDKYEARQKRARMQRVNGLAWCAQAVMQAATVQIPNWVAIIGLVYTLFGILGLFLFARYLERNKPIPHASASPQDVQPPFSARFLLGLRNRSRALFARPGPSG